MWWLLACAFGPGQGFGEITDVQLDARFEPGAARDLGDNTVLSNLSYAIQVTAFTIDVGDLGLQAIVGGENVGFDPANPPEGYGLCHGGHCHADDGRLVDYADVIAELSGGTATLETVVSLPISRTLDLLAGESLTLTPEPATLGITDLSKTTLPISAIYLEASASDGDGNAWPITVDVTPTEALGGPLELSFNRDEPPEVALDILLAPDGTLFDDVDFATTGEIFIDDSTTSNLTILDKVMATEPTITILREE